MALTEGRMELLLAYCRIDDPEEWERPMIEELYGAATAYMSQAGVSEPEEGTPRRAQYDLCVNALVLDGYERRDMTVTGTIVADNPAFRRTINQLKLTEPV